MRTGRPAGVVGVALTGTGFGAMHTGLPTLLISRDRLRDGELRHAATLPLGTEWGPDGFALASDPSVEVSAEESRGGRVRVTGALTARLIETCSRCLEKTERTLEVPLDLRFEPDLDPWDEGPGLYRLDANREELNVGPALREELLLALPEYPLCREGCAGLCPRCGADLNETECDCADDEGDPRWDTLRRQLAAGTGDDEQQDG